MIFRLSFLLALGLFLGCGGGSSTLTVQGTLMPLIGNDFSSVPSTANIFVPGFDPQVVKATFDSGTNPNEAPRFEIPEVPQGEYVVFSVTGSGLSSFSTFPIFMNGESIQIPAVRSGFKTELEVEATASNGVLPGQSFGADKAVLFAVLRPDGSCQTSTFTTVTLRNSSEEVPTQVRGPYFWNQAGSMDTLAEFGDPYCRFVFFNVDADVYELRFFSGSILAEAIPVVALAGSLIVGYNLP